MGEGCIMRKETHGRRYVYICLSTYGCTYVPHTNVPKEVVVHVQVGLVDLKNQHHLQQGEGGRQGTGIEENNYTFKRNH